MTRETQTLIIGAGPAGLATAYALQGDTLVLEKEANVGGLCRSLHVRGGVFDFGGHSFHTPHPEVRDLVDELLGGEVFTQQRDARVYSHGTLIPYPFQRYYDRLPDPDVVRACEDGLRSAAAAPAASPANFEEYIVRKFGRGIADHFMLPYNRKLWARDIRTISCEWTSERVAAPRGETERFDTTDGQRKPLQPDTVVGYPNRGGFEEIYRAFLPRIPAVELNSAVVRIDPAARTATTADGRVYRWQHLVSTMPLPILTRVVTGTPEEIKRCSDRLEFMSLRVELLLADRRLDTPIQRIYCADPSIPPHKIAFNHNSSDALRARPRHAIMAEVSVSPEKPVVTEEIAPRTIALLCDLGILDSPHEIIWRGYLNVRFAYPVYTHRRPELVGAIKDWLAKHHIYTVGRFGDWEYVNSDRCIARGLELGRELRARYPDAIAAHAPTR